MVPPKALILMLGSCALGCAPAPVMVPLSPPPVAPPVLTRPEVREGVPRAEHSLLMKPTLVEDLVVQGAESDVRILLGAVFGSGLHGGRHTMGLALVFQAIGTPVEPALGVSRSIEVMADGEVVVSSPIELGQLYHRDERMETLIVPIDPAHLGDIVGADRVEMQLGTTVAFRLGEQNLRDFGELMSKITEDVNRVRRAVISESPLRKGL